MLMIICVKASASWGQHIRMAVGFMAKLAEQIWGGGRILINNFDKEHYLA
jgi:hypothetical protein